MFPVRGFDIYRNLGQRVHPGRPGFYTHVQTTGDMRATGLAWCKELAWVIGVDC